MHLHYYSTTSIIKNIKEGHLPLERITHPIIENINLDSISTSKKRLSQKDFHSEMQIQYQNLPESLSSMITFEYFLEQSQKKRSQIESALHERKTSDEQLLFNSELINKIYTLNLFESNQHFNLWKYHADNFTGLCITLNLDSIKNGTYNKKKQLRKVQALNYTQDKEIENTKDNPLPGIFDMPVELVNEKGWRLAIAKQQCHYNKEKQYILNLKKTDIDSITFGINIDKEIKESTMRYFKTDLNLKHITFQQLYTSNRHFEFSVRPLK